MTIAKFTVISLACAFLACSQAANRADDDAGPLDAFTESSLPDTSTTDGAVDTTSSEAVDGSDALDDASYCARSTFATGNVVLGLGPKGACYDCVHANCPTELNDVSTASSCSFGFQCLAYQTDSSCSSGLCTCEASCLTPDCAALFDAGLRCAAIKCGSAC